MWKELHTWLQRTSIDNTTVIHMLCIINYAVLYIAQECNFDVYALLEFWHFQFPTAVNYHVQFALIMFCIIEINTRDD